MERMVWKEESIWGLRTLHYRKSSRTVKAHTVPRVVTKTQGSLLCAQWTHSSRDSWHLQLSVRQQLSTEVGVPDSQRLCRMSDDWMNMKQGLNKSDLNTFIYWHKELNSGLVHMSQALDSMNTILQYFPSSCLKCLQTAQDLGYHP